jgi:hypothetical protein
MKSLFLLLIFGIGMCCGKGFEPSFEGSIVFRKNLSTDVQVVVTRSTKDYNPTNSDRVVFGSENYLKTKKQVYDLHPEVSLQPPDLENTFRFYLATNGAVSGVKLWQTEVVGFKSGFFSPSGYVILDCWVSRSNLVVAYRYNVAICCDVIDVASKQGLPKEKVIVLPDASMVDKSTNSILIMPEHNDGATRLKVSIAGKHPLQFKLFEGTWIRDSASN